MYGEDGMARFDLDDSITAQIKAQTQGKADESGPASPGGNLSGLREALLAWAPTQTERIKVDEFWGKLLCPRWELALGLGVALLRAISEDELAYIRGDSEAYWYPVVYGKPLGDYCSETAAVTGAIWWCLNSPGALRELKDADPCTPSGNKTAP